MKLYLLAGACYALRIENPYVYEDNTPGYKPSDQGTLNPNRIIPERFTGDNADKLMHSIISKYAVETKDPVTKKPTGHFFLDRAAAEAISREVIGTHLHLTGAKASEYFDEHVPDTWQRFDVNKEGWVEAERMPQFLRIIVGNVEAGFGL